MEITADRDCTVGAYHCLRMLDFTLDPPTWNKYRPNEQKAWGSPGGTGGGDSSSIGSIDLVAETPGSISNSALSSALQAMVDGSEQVFLLRRTDSDNYTVSITGQVTIEFELNSN